MKPIGLALLVVSALYAQNRSGFVNQGIIRFPGSVVFPGGTSAIPGVQRTLGNGLYPGGGGAQIGVPGILPVNPVTNRFGFKHNGYFGNNGGYVGGGTGYLIPNSVGDYSGYMGDPSVAPPMQQAPQPLPQQAPNITIIYPPASAPMMINPGSAAQSQGFSIYQPPFQQPQAPPAPMAAPQPVVEPTRYLIALKDHTVYSASAYWVQGDTLHYFTDGNTHNQASLSLVDRELTKKLNLDSGVEMKLPPAK